MVPLLRGATISSTERPDATMPVLTCPACKSTDVEKVKLNTLQGRKLLRLAKKNNKSPAFLFHASIVEAKESDAVYIYHCESCENLEVWDLKSRQLLLKTQARVASFKSAESAKKDLLAGVFISLGIIMVAFSTVFGLEWKGIIDIAILDFGNNLLTFAVSLALAIAGFFGFILVMSYGVLRVIDRHINLMKFTYRLHELLFGEHLYFLEYHSKVEQVDLKASTKRAALGTMLVLGIAVIIIENFLTIPDLQPYFWTATYITIVAVVASLPIIVTFLYVSPLLTSEINLCFYNKDDRELNNVGQWLDNGLQLFAVVDIFFTFIIIMDSAFREPGAEGSATLVPGLQWIVIIIALLLLIFANFFLFTIIFNRFYHARLKEKFREYMKGVFNLPIRKVGIQLQEYYCWNCGAKTDHVQRDTCSNCRETIPKCSICNEIIDISNPANPKDKFGTQSTEDLIKSVVGKVQTKMSGTTVEMPYVRCPHCRSFAHLDEFLSWLKMRNRECPVCKEKIEVEDLLQ